MRSGELSLFVIILYLAGTMPRPLFCWSTLVPITCGRIGTAYHLGEIGQIVQVGAHHRSSHGTLRAESADYKQHRTSRI